MFSLEIAPAIRIACFRNSIGRSVNRAPANVPNAQQPLSHSPVCHQPARKNAANGKTQRYQAPCIQTERPMPRQVNPIFNREGFSNLFRDQANSSA